MNDSSRFKFDAALAECRRHAAVLDEARLASADTWRLLREVRNSLAHEYPENPALQAAAMTRLVAGVGELLAPWSGVEHYCADHLG